MFMITVEAKGLVPEGSIGWLSTSICLITLPSRPLCMSKELHPVRGDPACTEHNGSRQEGQ